MVQPGAILDELNPAQREAARATRGPVAILAGAGTGKTTTITHRIAYQVASGAFDARAILAVTFTQKAAGELRERLARLGVEGVEARTFHAAALAQLSGLWQRHTGEPMPEILDHKAPIIASLANALPPPHRFLPRRDLAGEIEWAKNRLIPATDYLPALTRERHEPPIPPELMDRVFTGYERRKSRIGKFDFEDMLGLAVRLFDDYPAAADAVRSRFAAFTVDEFQDVNPLQAALLDRWLGDRDELCVVGDDYQTIFAFTGASSSYLLEFPRRYPDATVVTLEDNYRSTPQVLGAANRLAGRLHGSDKRLRAREPDGPEPVVRAFADEGAEVTAVLAEARRLHEIENVPWEAMAVIHRINARSEPYEEALAEAHIPYQVRDGAFLRRPGPRGVLARLRREPDSGSLADAVGRVTEAMGYAPQAEPGSDEEVALQADLARMRALAREFEAAAPEPATSAHFAAELERRFAAEEAGRGLQLMTYHRSKGLEFEAVFLPRLLSGELPFRNGRSVADPDEERRLFYVGLTRARRWLHVSWATDRKGSPSPFVREAFPQAPEDSVPSAPAKSKRGPTAILAADGPLLERLKAWRKERARADGVPAYVVFHDSTLADVAAARPRSASELVAIKGIGPTKVERYGAEVLALVGSRD
jgi:DNA helicase-2/ATP-dependent DNA helicase PcrA